MATIDLPFSPSYTLSFIPHTPASAPAKAPVSPRPRLRSCLSPSRSPSITLSSTESYPTPSASRSTSFSSCTSGSGEAWKRTKCVRWQEMNGCAVTSTHDTYSHEEYDRTPLEPPTQAERACVLPERGTRSLSSTRDCFLSDLFDEVDDECEPTHCPDYLASPEEISRDSFFLRTPPPTEACSEDGDCDDAEGQEEAHGQEDKEWEECMERRRMMFARMCPQLNAEGGERHPEFEGYRSISATLVQLLKSVGCEEGEEEGEEGEEGEGQEEEVQRDCGFGFTRMNFATTVDHDNDHDLEPDTPSLISSAGSEAECVIVSPTAGCEEDCVGTPAAAIVPVPIHQAQAQTLGVEEVVLTAWAAGAGEGAGAKNGSDAVVGERGRDRDIRPRAL
ncbi:hypothetical protein I317_02035 [Kwoniella heveanensis CBS 569]|nr:hypothetical protein I317_02035 [Kwoniella heveanensis CBS 569]